MQNTHIIPLFGRIMNCNLGDENCHGRSVSEKDDCPPEVQSRHPAENAEVIPASSRSCHDSESGRRKRYSPSKQWMQTCLFMREVLHRSPSMNPLLFCLTYSVVLRPATDDVVLNQRCRYLDDRKAAIPWRTGIRRKRCRKRRLLSSSLRRSKPTRKTRRLPQSAKTRWTSPSKQDQ